jgi:photosystem II stability/assembly factor-like uncharacterized protein
VGRDGTILRTTNGGASWITQTSGTMEHLNEVCFSDVNTGTVVGGETALGTSIILRTTNGGENWISQSSVTNKRLSDVSFTDANTGTVVGDNGIILRTTNGGVTFIDNEPTQPTDFILEHNFPNPFNPSTKITWQSPVGSHQTIKVFDVLGNHRGFLLSFHINQHLPNT